MAEIQQRSDATFRLFDHGRQREIHVDNAVAAANAGPAECQSVPRRLTDARSLLVASPHFVLERIDLPPNSNWELDAEQETWVLVVEGHAQVGLMNAFVGEAIFVEADRASLKVGTRGLKASVGLSGPQAQAGACCKSSIEQNASSETRQFRDQPSIGEQRRVILASDSDGGAIVTQLSRLAFIGNSLPRRCGIATFTTDLQQAVAASAGAGGDIDRGDDRSWSRLRLSIRRSASDQR